MINTKKIGLNEFYKNYSDNPNIIQEFKISKEQFKRVIKSFSKKELDKILLDSEEVKLPILGTLRIKKIRQNLERQLYKNRLRIDWKETRKTGSICCGISQEIQLTVYAWSRCFLEEIALPQTFPHISG